MGRSCSQFLCTAAQTNYQTPTAFLVGSTKACIITGTLSIAWQNRHEVRSALKGALEHGVHVRTFIVVVVVGLAVLGSRVKKLGMLSRAFRVSHVSVDDNNDNDERLHIMAVRCNAITPLNERSPGSSITRHINLQKQAAFASVYIWTSCKTS